METVRPSSPTSSSKLTKLKTATLSVPSTITPPFIEHSNREHLSAQWMTVEWNEWMNLPNNTSVSPTQPGYIASIQSNQADYLPTGSTTIKLQEDLILTDPEDFQNLSLKSYLQKSKCLFTPLASKGVKQIVIKIFKSWTSEIYILVRMGSDGERTGLNSLLLS